MRGNDREITNPLFKDITIHINGTVTDKTITVNPFTGEQGDLRSQAIFKGSNV
jgi:hypothetical protein